MKSRIVTLAFVLLVSIVGQDCIHAQKNNTEFNHILKIDTNPLTRKEHRALMNPKNHKEYDVVVKKIKANLAFSGKEGYIVYYYYEENNELKSEWIERPDSTKYDQFHYTWEPGLLKWKFTNSKTGRGTMPMTKKFD